MNEQTANIEELPAAPRIVGIIPAISWWSWFRAGGTVWSVPVVAWALYSNGAMSAMVGSAGGGAFDPVLMDEFLGTHFDTSPAPALPPHFVDRPTEGEREKAAIEAERARIARAN